MEAVSRIGCDRLRSSSMAYSLAAISLLPPFGASTWAPKALMNRNDPSAPHSPVRGRVLVLCPVRPAFHRHSDCEFAGCDIAQGCVTCSCCVLLPCGGGVDLGKRREQGLVERPIAEAAVEAFDDDVLQRCIALPGAI